MTRIVPFILSLMFITSCSGTRVVSSWDDDTIEAGYSKYFVIAISDSQQNRRIFEDLLVENIENQGAKATPSYELISSKQTIDRETVVKTLTGLDYDAVLVSYLVDTHAELVYHDSPIGTTYSGSPDTNMLSSTLIGTRGRYDIDEKVELKTDLYDVSKRELVWSINTRTSGPESIDDLIVEVTETISDELQDSDKIARSSKQE